MQPEVLFSFSQSINEDTKKAMRKKQVSSASHYHLS